MDNVPKQLGIDDIFFCPLSPTKLWETESFWKYLEPTLKKMSEKDPDSWGKYINQVLASYCVTPHLATADTPFFLVYERDQNLHLKKFLEPM